MLQLRRRRSPTRLVEYDADRRRVWIRGRRLHHGATGGFVTIAACLGLMAGQAPTAKQSVSPRSMLALALAGGALMAHDWKDRSVWFKLAG